MTSSSLPTDLLARIDRLESIDAIRQLAGKYSLSLDMRDIDAHVNLFAPDIRVGREKVGRAHLKAWVDSTLRDQFSGTSHHLGQHIIEFSDPDHATGLVYSKNEHETGPEWVIMQMLYWDDYERVDGEWFFRRRLPCYWYATDLNKPPIGERKMRWPGREPYPVVEGVLGRAPGQGRIARSGGAGADGAVPRHHAPRCARPQDSRALNAAPYILPKSLENRMERDT